MRLLLELVPGADSTMAFSAAESVDRPAIDVENASIIDMRDLVDTEALQSFMAVADEFSFRRAAARLNIDQSALSRRIAKLEAQLGFALFARTSREVRLTEAGRTFYDANLETLTRLRETVARARLVAEGKTGHLRIGYMSFAAIETMPRAVGAFRAAHPEISVEISYLRTQGQKLALARGEIDAGFMIGPFIHPDFATLSLAAEPLMALLPVGHKLAARREVPLAELARYDLILGDVFQWEFYRTLIAELFSAQGLAFKPALEVSSTLGILGLVAAGLGVSLYPAGLARFEPARVVLRPVADCDRRIETILAWRKAHTDAALARFVECCRRGFPLAGEG
jgi:DNA-binding transcriptional LysR family regulator